MRSNVMSVIILLTYYGKIDMHPTRKDIWLNRNNIEKQVRGLNENLPQGDMANGNVRLCLTFPEHIPHKFYPKSYANKYAIYTISFGLHSES